MEIEIEKTLIKIKDTIQDCNVNFLVGSGMSAPYLGTLWYIEAYLTELDSKLIDDEKKMLVRASLYKKFFDDVISKNTDILSGNEDSAGILVSYKNFLKIINLILLKRKSTILSKQVNLFTTNIDIFLEKALEDLGLEYNDGFNGRFNPMFSLTNFKKSHLKKSLHYDNTSELPVFNLLKVHGSLTWEMVEENKKIKFSSELEPVSEIDAKGLLGSFVEIDKDDSLGDVISKSETQGNLESVKPFIDSYEKLSIVNPTKDKFRYTLLNQTHYELLRIYSNELEKENTVLFVMGFSFADEHIREITLRAANSNPTLMIYIIAHTSKSKKDIEEAFSNFENLSNRNIQIISPAQEGDGKKKKDTFSYDFTNINQRIFDKLADKFLEKDVNQEENEENIYE